MSLKRIEIKNFKSFKELKINLGKFNTLIGDNASGKSNFIQIFKFLVDIANFGLDNAVSMQGGIEYLRNINIGASENFSLKVVSDQKAEFTKQTKKGLIGIKIYETIYEFALKFNKGGFKIAKDNFIYKCEFVKLKKEKEKIGQGEIISSRDKEGKIKISLSKEVPIKKEDIYTPFLKEEKLSPTTLLFQRSFFFMPPLYSELFSDISIYDFDPNLPKKAIPITGKAELEKDGNNLFIILKNIMKNKEKRRKLFNLVKDLLPFINNFGVEKFANKSLLFELQEIYFKNQYLPVSLISDGTINIIALIVALYFEKKSLTIIEEPERNIHPYLISKIVDMMKDVSEKKQIIITTHNPEIVKYTGLNNILIASRDEEGFSLISRPTDKEEVKIFLQNKIGIEDLYVQNLLKV